MAERAVAGVDGTQEPSPPPVLSDPLSGLVTGSSFEVHRLDAIKVPEIRIELPDPEEVRKNIDAVLDGEGEDVPARPRPRQWVPPAEVPGMVKRPARQWQAGAAAMARRLRATRDDKAPVPRSERKSSGMTAGAAVVIALVIVTVIIVIYLIRGLVSTISSIFG